MDRERRQTKRGEFLTEVEYEGGGVRAQTRISDINLSGVFIDALSPLPVGAALKLKFALPGGHLITTEGVVVHSQDRIGMGVRFTTLTPEDTGLIRAAIDAHR